MTQHLKFISLLIFTLSASYTSAQSIRKLMERPYGIIESKWEKDAQGATELNYYNEDYCDYYLYRANDRSYNLSHGKNTVFKIEKNAQVDNPFKSASSYMFYRGRFPKDFNIQTAYALPVKDNQKTAWKTDPREPFKTLNFHIKQGDTIYATRSGIACKTTNPRQLLIYHPDQTFAAYLVMSENFIEPGEEIQVGQAIGKAGPTGASISFFFLDENKFKGGLSSGYHGKEVLPSSITNLVITLFHRFSANVLQAGSMKGCRNTSSIAPLAKKECATRLPNTNKEGSGRCTCWEK